MPRTTSHMTRAARVLTLAATLLLGAMYFTPVWSVRLVAPQYPEGLGMLIRLNTIEGVKEHDLRNINSLNHYIGMKAIEPEAIPELEYMPWVVGGLIAAGLVVVAVGRRRGLVAWAVGFAIAGAAGLYDFWRWSYDYGHNLDTEKAIIIVPGMSYQPPLIGTKQLLNFTATSMPHVGGIVAGVAFALVAVALVLSYRRRVPVAAASVALAAACASGAPTIVLGVEACAECRMIVSDGRFAAVLVTSTGKSVPFDSIECLLEYLAKKDAAQVRGVFVADATAGRMTLLAVERATFVRGGALRPPMGDVIAVSDVRSVTGEIVTWEDLRAETASGTVHAR